MFVVDQVVAVVGNRPILASQIDEQLFTLVAEQQVPAPTTAQDTTRLREQILGDLIDEEIMVQEAQRDTAIVVTEEEVQQGVEQQVKNVRGRFTSGRSAPSCGVPARDALSIAASGRPHGAVPADPAVSDRGGRATCSVPPTIAKAGVFEAEAQLDAADIPSASRHSRGLARGNTARACDSTRALRAR